MSYGSPFAYCSTVAAALVIYVATSAVPFFLHKQYIIIPIKTAPPTEPSTMQLHYFHLFAYSLPVFVWEGLKQLSLHLMIIL